MVDSSASSTSCKELGQNCIDPERENGFERAPNQIKRRCSTWSDARPDLAIL